MNDNTTQSPIFALHEPQHFSDYGFDSQFDYFQVLEEARKHKRETCSSRSNIDNLHFKLQKPITKDDNSKKIKKSRKRWWKHTLHFFKRKRTASPSSHDVYGDGGVVRAMSGPVYLAEFPLLLLLLTVVLYVHQWTVFWSTSWNNYTGPER